MPEQSTSAKSETALIVTLESEATRNHECIHAIWGDDQGTFYAVGGSFSEPFAGIALVRSEN